MYFPTEAVTQHLISAHHNVPVLESHFGMAMMVSKPAAVKAFTNNTLMQEFLQAYGLSEFTPAIYATPKSAVYPCYIRFSDTDEVFAVATPGQVSAVVGKHKGQPFILTEKADVAFRADIQFVSRNGKLLGTTCLLVKDPAAGAERTDGDQESGIIVPCPALDAIAPVSDVVSRIIEKSAYNGLGSVSLRFSPNNGKTAQSVSQLLSSIQPVSGSTQINTAFGVPNTSYYTGNYASIPKVDSITPHAGQSLFTYFPSQLVDMVRLYLSEVGKELA